MKPTPKRPRLDPVMWGLIRRLEKHRAVIGKERDAMVRLQDEIEALRYPTDRGVEALDEAIQALSEQA